jgi:hypothetical protein
MAKTADKDSASTQAETPEKQPEGKPEDKEAAGRARNLAAELYAEAVLEGKVAGQGVNGAGGMLGEAARRPHDIWTLDRLRKRGPVTGDLLGTGEFLFTFNPVLGTTYCQERYAIAQEYVEGDYASYMRTQKAYAEIVFYAMRGGSEPLRETLDDPETGEPLMEPDPDNPGEERHQSVPLPITQDSVKRMDMEMLADFLLAMRKAIEGEVSTTP